jgi:hypothetical protein
VWWTIVKLGIAAGTIVLVSEVSHRYPRVGALLLTLPLISILAFIMAWTKYHDLPSVSRLSREMLLLVPLGLPFFVPLGFAERLGLGFWAAFAWGVAFAATTIGLWFWLGPSRI